MQIIQKSAEEVDVKEDLPRLKLTIGLYEMNTWYNSSIPSEIASNQHLFVCEKCLNFKASAEALQRHLVFSFISFNLIIISNFFSFFEQG